MLDLNYQVLNFANVQDLNDFYRGTLPEINKIKALVSTLRLLYSLPPDRVILQVSEGDRVYKVILKNEKKGMMGWFIYIPLQKRLDIYSSNDPNIPLIQWKNKKAVTKNYDQILDYAKIDKVFDRILNVI